MNKKDSGSFAFFETLQKIGLVRIVVLFAFGITGAWLTFGLAVSGATRIKAPDAALVFRPKDSTALAAKADQLFFADPRRPVSEIKRLAIKAIVEQPVNPKALRILGYLEDEAGASEQAEKLVRMAAKLSPREPGAQLWLIEFFARKGDIPQTLVHYDIVLRTRPETQTILYPRLVNAIEDREVRIALKPYLRANVGWAIGFLSYANGNSKNLPALVSLILETGGLSDREDARVQKVALIGRLIGEQNFDEARRLFLRVPGSSPRKVTSAGFDSNDREALFGAMGWQLIDDPDAGGGFSGDRKDVTLSLYANSATTRQVAKKLLYLTPGSYTLNVRLKNLDRGNGGFLRWELKCPSKAGENLLWSLDSDTFSLTTGFAIPRWCPVQYLNLIVSGGSGQTGLEATIGSVSISSE